MFWSKRKTFKHVQASGRTWVIKRLRPEVDFPTGEIPRLIMGQPEPVDTQRFFRDILTIVQVGVVDPEINAIELFTNQPRTFLRLMLEVCLHSMPGCHGILNAPARFTARANLESMIAGGFPEEFKNGR